MHALRPILVLAVLALTAIMTFAAAADDWVAVKLRGTVFALDGDNWVQLHRGDVVPDDRVIRTQPSGRVTFQRGQETIDLGPSTQIQIFDKSGRQFTTVNEFYGKVAIEAEVQNVQHFSVRTPYLAAVVKGTRFTVTSDDDSSSVSVQRGHVAVEDFVSNENVLLSAGQSIDTDNFVVTGANGHQELFAPPGTGGPAQFYASIDEDISVPALGGGDSDGGLLESLLGSGDGGDGISASVGLGDLGGVSLGLGGGDGLDVSAGIGGITLDAGVGGGDGINLDLGGGGSPVLGIEAGSGNGVTVTTPLGALGLNLGGLL